MSGINNGADLAKALADYATRSVAEMEGCPTSVVDTKCMHYQQNPRAWEFDAMAVVRYLRADCGEPAFLFVAATELDVPAADERAVLEGLKPGFVEIYMNGDQVRWLLGVLDPPEPAL